MRKPNTTHVWTLVESICLSLQYGKILRCDFNSDSLTTCRRGRVANRHGGQPNGALLARQYNIMLLLQLIYKPAESDHLHIYTCAVLVLETYCDFTKQGHYLCSIYFLHKNILEGKLILIDKNRNEISEV